MEKGMAKTWRLQLSLESFKMQPRKEPVKRYYVLIFQAPLPNICSMQDSGLGWGWGAWRTRAAGG